MNTNVLIALALFAIVVSAGCNPSSGRPYASGTAVTPQETLASEVQRVATGQTDTIRLESIIVTDTELSAFAGLKGLRELFIEESTITDAGVKQLQDLPQLETIRIRGATIGDEGLKHLCQFSNLKSLNLPQGQFHDAALAELQHLPQLEQLRFGSPHVTDQGLEVIAKLPRLKGLHVINVPITDAGLDSLHGMKQLEAFYIDGARVTDAGIERLLKALPNLHFHIDQHHHDRDPHTHKH